jgi:hypothetical protein
MQSMYIASRAALRLLSVSLVCAWSALASAQVPIPSASTPTLQGGTPISGAAVGGQIGYAALRADFFYGKGNWDLNVSAGVPTFGGELPGYNQDLGFDLRVPFRIRIVEWAKGTGSIKVGPLFHVGRHHWHHDWRAVGTGATIGFVADVALPKLFKVIMGIEQQFGMLNVHHRPSEEDHTFFAGATWFVLGLDAFWRESLFFTVVANVGAQYGSDRLHRDNHALYRQLFGVGYKFM